MHEIAELERRIASALDRIARRLDGEGAAHGGSQSEAAAQLSAALDEERMMNAQLTERLRVLTGHHAEEKAQIAQLSEKLSTAIDARDATFVEMQSALSAASDELLSLRQAALRGTTLPHQINRALLAEVETLRALRAADAAGIAAVMAELEPIVAGGKTDA